MPFARIQSSVAKLRVTSSSTRSGSVRYWVTPRHVVEELVRGVGAEIGDCDFRRR